MNLEPGGDQVAQLGERQLAAARVLALLRQLGANQARVHGVGARRTLRRCLCGAWTGGMGAVIGGGRGWAAMCDSRTLASAKLGWRLTNRFNLPPSFVAHRWLALSTKKRPPSNALRAPCSAAASNAAPSRAAGGERRTHELQEKMTQDASRVKCARGIFFNARPTSAHPRNLAMQSVHGGAEANLMRDNVVSSGALEHGLRRYNKASAALPQLHVARDLAAVHSHPTFFLLA